MSEKIVITGGPAGGKSSALTILADHYRTEGFKVYTTPEIATLFHYNGVDLATKHHNHTWELEYSAVQTQLALEDSIWRIAETDKNAIILHDRGIQDHKAYMPDHMWEALMLDYETLPTPHGHASGRYDLVIHLVTAADGASTYFNLDNPARAGCTIDLARELDKKTFDAWNCHHNRVRIDNSTDFEGKIRRVKETIDAYLEKKHGQNPST